MPPSPHPSRAPLRMAERITWLLAWFLFLVFQVIGCETNLTLCFAVLISASDLTVCVAVLISASGLQDTLWGQDFIYFFTVAPHYRIYLQLHHRICKYRKSQTKDDSSHIQMLLTISTPSVPSKEMLLSSGQSTLTCTCERTVGSRNNVDPKISRNMDLEIFPQVWRQSERSTCLE